MIQVAVLTTVWQRPRITIPHFYWMNRFKGSCRGLGIQLKPFYVLTPGDKHLKSFLRSLQSYQCDYIINESKRLTDKSKAGLEALKRQHSFDYLMHLDSDEFLSFELMERWKKEFENSTQWFGSSSCYFLDTTTGEPYEFLGYPDHPVKNGGTCISRAILEHANWNLWPRQRDKGLNVMERRRIEKLGYRIQPIDTQDIYGVVEAKGRSESIHGLDWFQQRDLLRELSQEDYNEFFDYHSGYGLI